MNPSLVLFDVGGVLLEYRNVFKTAAKDLGLTVDILYDTFDKYDSDITVGKITPQQLLELCATENNLVFNHEYDFLTSWALDFEKISPTYELIQQVKNKYKVGILSNIYKGMFPIFVANNLIPDLKFDYLFTSCDIGYKKPDTEIYSYIESTTGLNGNQILFIDDRDDYLSPAKARGWNIHKFDRQTPKTSTTQLQTDLNLKESSNT